jgi:hypothetical protein
MADLESNKRTVIDFYELAFNGKQPEQAVEKHVGSEYSSTGTWCSRSPRRARTRIRCSEAGA